MIYYYLLYIGEIYRIVTLSIYNRDGLLNR